MVTTWDWDQEASQKKPNAIQTCIKPGCINSNLYQTWLYQFKRVSNLAVSAQTCIKPGCITTKTFKLASKSINRKQNFIFYVQIYNMYTLKFSVSSPSRSATRKISHVQSISARDIISLRRDRTAWATLRLTDSAGRQVTKRRLSGA